MDRYVRSSVCCIESFERSFIFYLLFHISLFKIYILQMHTTVTYNILDILTQKNIANLTLPTVYYISSTQSNHKITIL